MQYKLLIVEDDAELQAPYLIVLDINMPHMDGLEVCVTIRDLVSCPILFFTAKVEAQ